MLYFFNQPRFKITTSLITLLSINACASSTNSDTTLIPETTTSTTISTQSNAKKYPVQPALFKDGKYRNVTPRPPLGTSKTLKLLSRFLFEEDAMPKPSKPVPVNTLTSQQLDALPDDKTTVIRLGHSSILLKINKEYWLIDPMFSERAFPVQFMGPKRFHQPPISIDNLPAITGIIISHNHYDHLDKYAIKQLKEKVKHFYVPLGNSSLLEKWGVDKTSITEFDWWQTKKIDSITLTATPAQHFSGRSLFDGNQSLWSSWIISNGDTRIFYSGDSGYFAGFKTIGDKYGPFDLSIMETGAYNKEWPFVHMQPEQSVQAHIDLNADLLLPVHNGTFDLAFHTWFDPFDRITAAGDEKGQTIITPIMGQTVTLRDKQSIDAAINLNWWEDIK